MGDSPVRSRIACLPVNHLKSINDDVGVGCLARAGRFGSFARESCPKRIPPILAVYPDTVVGRIGQSMRLFRDGISSVKGSRFATGFADTNIAYLQTFV